MAILEEMNSFDIFHIPWCFRLLAVLKQSIVDRYLLIPPLFNPRWWRASERVWPSLTEGGGKNSLETKRRRSSLRRVNSSSWCLTSSWCDKLALAFCLTAIDRAMNIMIQREHSARMAETFNLDVMDRLLDKVCCVLVRWPHAMRMICFQNQLGTNVS